MAAFKMTFIKSASYPNTYPKPLLPEIALIGRSNSGKSSLLNTLSNQKIAKVSATPGKTQLLNFFELDKKYYWVDMPGYGYAKRSRKEILAWKNMIEIYFRKRQSLIGFVLVMDIRRNWTTEEGQLLDWLQADLSDQENFSKRLKKENMIIVLNKCDKLNNHQQKEQSNKIKSDSGIDNVFTVSCKKKLGILNLQKHIYNKFEF